jgi:hypothetical protein
MHILPTDKPSRLLKSIEKGNLFLSNIVTCGSKWINQNIYITNDEEIKKPCWVMPIDGIPYKLIDLNCILDSDKKIILATDQDLIKDGVQAIDYDFLKWFVKNPSCEQVEVDNYVHSTEKGHVILYNIVFGTSLNNEVPKTTQQLIDEDFEGRLTMGQVIPKEEPKQLFTDYPIIELGDEEFKEAPIRECELLSFDDNKYCYVKVGGIEKEIKRCYIYPQKGRCGDVNCVSIKEIKELLKEEPKQECKDCNTSLEYCTCIEDTIDMKQETLEEFINSQPYYGSCTTEYLEGIEDGAKWQQQNSYSEEDVKNAFLDGWQLRDGDLPFPKAKKEWFNKFKKK